MEEPVRKIGPYKLLSKIGHGTFGVVWLAEKRASLSTTMVALKLPRGEDIDLETFRREAEIWVQASGHKNVLTLIEAEVYDEQVVIVSAYAPDGSLEDWRARHGGRAPSVDAACEMMEGVLSGLAHLHKRRIIHRDLKPDNILLQESTPLLADFGISRVLRSSSHFTKTISGTFAYMAPEAFDGKRDEQTDIWAAGIIFYELLAGRLPYDQQDTASLVGAIVRHDPPELPAGFVPEPVRRVVAKALRRDPRERYRTADEMRRDLREAGHQLWLERHEASRRVPETRQARDLKEVMNTPGLAAHAGGVNTTEPGAEAAPEPRRHPAGPRPGVASPPGASAGYAPSVGQPPGRRGHPALWLLLAGGLAMVAALAVGLLVAFNRVRTPPPDVAATVNGEPITLGDVDRIVNQQAQGQQLPATQYAAARLQALDRMIERQALYVYAGKEKTLPTDDEVTALVNQHRQKFTAEEWEKSLRENNLNEQQVREEARKDLAINRLRDATYGRITIRDQEITDFYNANRQKFLDGRGVGLAVIMADPAVNGTPDDSIGEAAAKSKIDNVYQALLGGGDFSEVARRRSEHHSAGAGGDIGFAGELELQNNDFPEEFIGVLFGPMRVGAVTPPVKFKNGAWYVFKLVRRQLLGAQMTLDSSPNLREQIKNTLINHRKQLADYTLIERAKREAEVVNYLSANMHDYLVPSR